MGGRMGGAVWSVGGGSRVLARSDLFSKYESFCHFLAVYYDPCVFEQQVPMPNNEWLRLSPYRFLNPHLYLAYLILISVSLLA